MFLAVYDYDDDDDTAAAAAAVARYSRVKSKM